MQTNNQHHHSNEMLLDGNDEDEDALENVQEDREEEEKEVKELIKAEEVVEMTDDERNRAMGCVLGAFVGDAAGATLEFVGQ